MNKGLLTGVSMIALVAAAATSVSSPAEAGDPKKGRYLSGDLHNHTVCSDGSTSVDTLVSDSLTYLDWFIMAGHSGSGSRDCRFNDTTQTKHRGGLSQEPGLPSGLPGDDQVLWSESGAEIMGLQADGTTPQSESGRMWRWQSLGQYQYADTVTDPKFIGDEGRRRNKPAFLGLEWVVPGHEHASVSIVDNQFPVSRGLTAGDLPNATGGNALKMSQFEYCFARNSDDTSGGFFGDWRCDISKKNNRKLIKRFKNFPEQGTADYNAAVADKGVKIDDTGDHVKSVAAIYWLKENAPYTSYAIPAHVERQGAFIPNDDEGFNVEHIRDWHTAGWDEERGINIAYGFESQPGHQPTSDRGSYSAGRPTAGLFTFGGTGCYAAAEASRPGKDFEGNDLTLADFADSGRFPEVEDDEDPAKVTLCRPGVRTMWDAMLSEGRRFFFSASSDWHNRGAFAYTEHQSTLDFLPGEYQKNHVFVKTRAYKNAKLAERGKGRFSRYSSRAEMLVASMRSGNSYATQGDLIDRFEFKACSGGKCAYMGETLKVRKGADVKFTFNMRDPRGTNNSQYRFSNPILKQLGIDEPVNEPSLRQVDVITGKIRKNGFFDPLKETAKYYNPMAPASTKIAATYTLDNADRKRKLQAGPRKRLSYTLKDVSKSMYLRLRGTNIPAGTPNARDENGNPLSDHLKNNIPCADITCPPHIQGVVTADVEAWSDLWFYSNPIFIEVQGKKKKRKNRRFSRR